MTHISLGNTRMFYLCYYFTIVFCIVMATAEDNDFLGSLDLTSIPKRNSNPTPTDVQIQCHSSHMCAALSKQWLMSQWGVSNINQLTLRERCDASAQENNTHIMICTNESKLTSCGSQFSQNDTHVTLSNTVLILLVANDPTSVSFVPAVKASLPWKCTYPMQLLVGVNFVPQISPVTVFLGNKTGYGKFEAAMFLYRDENFQNTYDMTPYLDITDRLRVKVQLLHGPHLSRVQIVKCWGTPVPFPDEDDMAYTLIDDYCPSSKANSADVKLRNNGDLQHASWEANVFRFVVSPEVYLHCHVRVCFEGTNCEKICPLETDGNEQGLRKRREVASSPNSGVLSLGPLKVTEAVPGLSSALQEEGATESDGDTAEESPWNLGGDMILGMPRLAVFGMIGVLGIVSLSLIIGVFIALHRRTMRLRREKVASNWEKKAAERPRLSGRFTLSDSPPFEIPLSVPNTIANFHEPRGNR